MELKHNVSLTASNQYWQVATSLIPSLTEARLREGITKKIPQFRSIRERMYKTRIPKIMLEFAYEVKETGDIIIMSELEATPASKFPPSEYRKLYETAKIKVSYEIPDGTISKLMS